VEEGRFQFVVWSVRLGGAVVLQPWGFRVVQSKCSSMLVKGITCCLPSGFCKSFSAAGTIHELGENKGRRGF
jgi:hypothetical protein